jgi:hypothetical protein
MKFKSIKCPKCERKGLHHPEHAHAQGWKEYSEIKCRFCKTRFKTQYIEKYIESQKF